jgi:hypothetical protein
MVFPAASRKLRRRLSRNRRSVLREFNDRADEAVVKVNEEFSLGDERVVYEAVADGPLLDFSPTEYKSAGVDQKNAEDCLRDGGHPFDVLESLRRDGRKPG